MSMGLPQHRERIYTVGINTSEQTAPMAWPQEVKPRTLGSVIRGDSTTCSVSLNKTKLRNIVEGAAKAIKQGHDLEKEETSSILVG